VEPFQTPAQSRQNYVQSNERPLTCGGELAPGPELCYALSDSRAGLPDGRQAGRGRFAPGGNHGAGYCVTDEWITEWAR